MKILCKKDVTSIDNQGTGVLYKVGDIWDAVIAVRGENAATFSINVGTNGWDEWFNEHFEIIE